jgi:hypothetical protein
MTNLDNPASRLYALMNEFYQLGHARQGVSALAIWQEILKANQFEIFRKIGEIENLVADVEKCIKNDNQIINKDRYTSWIPSVRQTLIPPHILGDSRSIATGYYTPGTPHMLVLEFCCEALAKSFGENPTTSEEISDLRSGVDSLVNEINEKITDAKTKNFFLDLLASLEHGIRNFQIRGSLGLDESLSVALGKLLRHKLELDIAVEKDTTGVIKRIMSFFKSTAEFADKAKKVNDGIALVTTAYDLITSNIPSSGS